VAFNWKVAFRKMCKSWC